MALVVSGLKLCGWESNVISYFPIFNKICCCFVVVVALTLLYRFLLLRVHFFHIFFFMFIWNSVYYDIIGQKNCFYLASGFKFCLSKEIKIIIGKVFYGGNFFTKPCSKEDRIIVNFNIFFVPYDRFFCTGLRIILPILKLKTSIAVFLCRRVVAP